jgi:hypothetical protein
MVQSTGAPHYPYWPPPHHLGFHPSNAMPFGQSPSFGTGQSPSNATNGSHFNTSMPFGRSSGFPQRQDQTTVLEHHRMRPSANQSQKQAQVTFNVAAPQHQGNRRTTMPPLLSAGKSQTNHPQSAESPTSDVGSAYAQFPTNHL